MDFEISLLISLIAVVGGDKHDVVVCSSEQRCDSKSPVQDCWADIPSVEQRPLPPAHFYSAPQLFPTTDSAALVSTQSSSGEREREVHSCLINLPCMMLKFGWNCRPRSFLVDRAQVLVEAQFMHMPAV